MILHVDMDAFYASVEQRDRPELQGQPVIVGGSPEGRGVVAAASYEARRFGVHSAMPTAQAMRLCPQAIIVKTRMPVYVAVSRQIHDIFRRYTPEIEPLSLDEAFLDVTGCAQLFGTAESIAAAIKRDIQRELKLIASVGVASNKFLAKLASDLEKPDGLTVIAPERVLQTLAPLPVSRLWGVGKVTERKLRSVNITTFGDFQRISCKQAEELFGSLGTHLWELAHGIDDRHVVPDRRAKSISHETTFPRDIHDIELLSGRLLELTEQVTGRLRAQRKRGKTVTIKVRYSDFHTITRSQSLPSPSDATDALWSVASHLLRTELPLRPLRVRLIGMGISHLEDCSGGQMELFGESSEPEVRGGIDRAADLIRAQFGTAALRRASTLRPPST